MHRYLILGALGLLIGCGGGDASGQLVDAMTGEGLGGVRIVAKATSPDASMTCQTFEAETDDKGAFTIAGLCGGSAYRLSTTDDTLWIPDFDQVPDGGQADIKLEAWHAPSGEGTYRLAGGKVEGVRTSTDLKREKILGSDAEIRYPARIAKTVLLIAPGEYLALVGKKTIENQKIYPLIPSGERKFGDENTKITMEPWSYIGVRFTDDTTYEEVAAALDESKVVTKEAGDRAAKYIPHDAVPAGRYVLVDESKKRGAVTLVDFGSAPEGSAPAAQPE